MMPVYMDSCHQQRNQMPFPHYYHPSHNNVPPHVMMDHSKPPLVYESWPHGSNYGYSMSCHGCCNHCNFPGCYAYRPSLSHLHRHFTIAGIILHSLSPILSIMLLLYIMQWSSRGMSMIKMLIEIIIVVAVLIT